MLKTGQRLSRSWRRPPSVSWTSFDSACTSPSFSSSSTLFHPSFLQHHRDRHDDHRSYSSSVPSLLPSIRRKRVVYERYNLEEQQQQQQQLQGIGGANPSSSSSSSLLSEPFAMAGKTDDSSIDEYTRKTSLSPWVPVPDSVARKIFDTATRMDPLPPHTIDSEHADTAGTEKQPQHVVHVELGCGDGRVNFAAILDYGFAIHESVGVDVDKNIIEVALERKRKIHPPPPIHFVVADLLSSNGGSSGKDDNREKKNGSVTRSSSTTTTTSVDVWKDHVERASILTMYFAKEGLEQIRPLLERSLMRNPNSLIKIFCCGYAMPGWESTMVETVLDMPVYYYEWGTTTTGGRVGGEAFGGGENIPLAAESFVDVYNLASPSSSPSTRGGVAGLYEHNDNPGTGVMDPFMQKKKNSNFRPDPLPGYHPDDLIDFGWDDFGDAKEDESKKKDR